MSERPTNRQRIELSLEKRIELIKCAESVPKPALKVLSSKFGIGKPTVGDIFDKLNELVWQWFCRARAKNIPISGPIIQ